MMSSPPLLRILVNELAPGPALKIRENELLGLRFKILENVDGLTRKILEKEEGADRRILEKLEEGDLKIRENDEEGDLRILEKDDGLRDSLEKSSSPNSMLLSSSASSCSALLFFKILEKLSLDRRDLTKLSSSAVAATAGSFNTNCCCR